MVGNEMSANVAHEHGSTDAGSDIPHSHHTPGPWTPEPCDYCTSECMTIQSSCEKIAENIRPENAHLIAAAPAMLTALENLYQKAIVGTDAERRAALEDAFRAIMQAKGEA